MDSIPQDRKTNVGVEIDDPNQFQKMSLIDSQDDDEKKKNNNLGVDGLSLFPMLEIENAYSPLSSTYKPTKPIYSPPELYKYTASKEYSPTSVQYEIPMPIYNPPELYKADDNSPPPPPYAC